MAGQPSAFVVMEACGSSHSWAREMIRLGHEVKLIAPQYVKPFVKRHKNDAADAEAIVIAAQRPEMRFVEPKTEDQQARAVLFRGRERLVRQRTELMNALRAVLCEYGHTAPQGIRQLKRIEAIIEGPISDLPELVREECRDLIEQIAEKTARISVKTKKAEKLAAQTDTARRLHTMPPLAHAGMRCRSAGVGPLTALAVEAFAPEMESFGCGRDFAAWLGLVPRQHSSGGKERLGRVSKAGQADIRRLLIIGAPLMHANMHCRAVDVAIELDGASVNPRGFLAGAFVGTKAEDARGNRFGQQDGTRDLGYVDETGRLSGSEVGRGCMIHMQQKTG